MANKRRKPRSTKWLEVPLDEPTAPWWGKIGQIVPLDAGVIALNIDFSHLVLVEFQQSGIPKTLSVPKLYARPLRVQYLAEWPLLAIFSDSSLELVDVSDPCAPKERLTFEEEQGHARALASMGEDFYVTHENGVAWLNPATRKAEHLFDVPNDPHFRSYPTALASAGSYLFVIGRHAGVNVFRRTGCREFTHVRTAQKGYTPTSCQWWAPGVLLLSGNEDVIALDASNPEKAKLLKSCKLSNLEIGPLCRVSETQAFVAGTHRRTHDLVFASIELANPLGAVVAESEIVGDPTFDWNSSVAVRVGNHTIAGSRYLDRPRVFRRA